MHQAQKHRVKQGISAFSATPAAGCLLQFCAQAGRIESYFFVWMDTLNKERGTVATDEYNSMSSMSHDIGLNPITQWLAFLAGGGVVLMILALILGVLNTADPSLVNIMLVGGLFMLVIGGVAWMAVARAHEHYDDINQPAPDDHHGHAAHDDEHAHDDHALEQAH